MLASVNTDVLVVAVLTKSSPLSQDKDAALSPSELKNLFCMCPYMPWGAEVYLTVPTTEQGYITNVGYRCQWTYVSFDAKASALLHFSCRRPAAAVHVSPALLHTWCHCRLTQAVRLP